MAKHKLSLTDLANNYQMVYSTNPDAINTEQEVVDTLAANQQKLVVRLDKKQRKGKTVTLVQGFEGKDQDLADLAKTLKTKCGVGGSAKDGEIILQGECKEKTVQLLQQMGYTKTKAQ